MPRCVYVNGRYVPYADAVVHVEDRGFQFADGIYEVYGVRQGRLLDEEGHTVRLARSLREMQMDAPVSPEAMRLICLETVRRNRVRDGLVYIQITRGVARREHAFPNPPVRPGLIVTAWPVDMAKARTRAARGMRVVTAPDIRWGRCDIKTVALVPNVLAMHAAQESGADDAWFVDRDGMVTEGTRANAWIVDAEGHLITRHTDAAILSGITRATLMKVAAERGLKVVERAFSADEAKAAREAFVTGAGSTVMPVVEIDGHVIANGVPGSIAMALWDAYETYAITQAAD
ncbi:MAG: D-amino-acid transaminase [bacterium]